MIYLADAHGNSNRTKSIAINLSLYASKSKPPVNTIYKATTGWFLTAKEGKQKINPNSSFSVIFLSIRSPHQTFIHIVQKEVK